MDDLSPQARERLARPAGEPLRPPPPDDHAAVARWRAGVHAAWLDGDPPASACGHEAVTIAGVRCLWAPGPAAGGNPPGPLGHEGPTLVYLHGGGYALGSPEVALPITERLAAGGLAVVSVDYRLAPEHPWPAAVDDALAVFRALRAASPHRPLAVGGDSAGGNLALSVAQRTRHDPHGGPAALVLFSPHLDHGGPLRPGSDTDLAGTAWLRAAYCGPIDPADPGISPLRGDLGGLPPTLLQVGTRDGLLGQAARFARAARRAGSDVTLDVWDGLWHTWQYHRNLPEADQALAEAADFVTATLARLTSGT